ncbi:MAG: hypothetical protein ACOY7J_03465 [Pseudomonadota bacterium]
MAVKVHDVLPEFGVDCSGSSVESAAAKSSGPAVLTFAVFIPLQKQPFSISGERIH